MLISELQEPPNSADCSETGKLAGSREGAIYYYSVGMEENGFYFLTKLPVPKHLQVSINLGMYAHLSYSETPEGPVVGDKRDSHSHMDGQRHSLGLLQSFPEGKARLVWNPLP